MNAAHIHLVGTGLIMEQQITPEAIAILRSCRRVYHLTASHDTLSRYCDDLVNWNDLYLSTSDPAVYRRMADVLLQDGASRPPVAFAVYGHPLVLVSTAQMVIQDAPARGLGVNVVPGISSIDVLLQHLLLDVGVAGLQIHEVNQMVARDVLPDPTVSCLILQVSSYGQNEIIRTTSCSSNRFGSLRDFLLRAYPPEHPAVLMTCPYLPGMRLARHDFSLGRLDEVAGVIHTGMSLFLPPRVAR